MSPVGAAATHSGTPASHSTLSDSTQPCPVPRPKRSWDTARGPSMRPLPTSTNGLSIEAYSTLPANPAHNDKTVAETSTSLTRSGTAHTERPGVGDLLAGSAPWLGLSATETLNYGPFVGWGRASLRVVAQSSTAWSAAYSA